MKNIINAYPNKQELKTLKSNMPQGYRKEVAEEAGCSENYVDEVFRAAKRSQKVVDAAYEVLSRHKAKREQQQQILNK